MQVIALTVPFCLPQSEQHPKLCIRCRHWLWLYVIHQSLNVRIENPPHILLSWCQTPRYGSGLHSRVSALDEMPLWHIDRCPPPEPCHHKHCIIQIQRMLHRNRTHHVDMWWRYMQVMYVVFCICCIGWHCPTNTRASQLHAASFLKISDKCSNTYT